MMSLATAEQRAIDLVRDMATAEGVFPSLSSMTHYATARAIAATLPADPDWPHARELYIVLNNLGGDEAVFVRTGEMDSGEDLKAIFAAIKRGRELATTS